MGLRVERVVLAVLASVLAMLGHVRSEFAQPFLGLYAYTYIYICGYVCIIVGELCLVLWAASTCDEPI